jgi:hypothetical protein
VNIHNLVAASGQFLTVWSNGNLLSGLILSIFRLTHLVGSGKPQCVRSMDPVVIEILSESSKTPPKNE